jgi:hypothetical protein
MRKSVLVSLLMGSTLLTGCVDAIKNPLAASGTPTSVSEATTVYVNASKRNLRNSPKFVVLPGTISTSSNEFKISGEQIAAMAEAELSKANFGVIERGSLGPLLREIQLAVEMGDTSKANRLMQTGKLKTTRWFLKLDVLKAEKKESAGGGALGVSGKSVTWNFTMRYKLIDAKTTEQVDSDTVTRTETSGGGVVSIGGITFGQEGGIQLDSVVEKLVQQCIAKVDAKNP